MIPLFAWPGDAVIIGVVIVVTIVVHAVLVFAIKRVVKSLMRQDGSGSGKFGARAARVMAKASGLSFERHRQRTATLGSLLRSVVTIVLYTVMVLTILSIVGVPMGPLLASAGVGGVALGFGAQSLVKDFLSGLFMIAEDQYGVGDFVKIGDISGTVEEVRLRVTKLRDASGSTWYVRNGEVINVGNVSQGWSTAMIDVPVAYNEEPERVIAILREVIADMDSEPEWNELMLEPPTVAGVESISGGTMTIRMFAKCAPNKQWGVQREIRDRAKRALDAAGVRGPLLLAGPSQP